MAFAKIHVNFETLKSNYHDYTHLPQPIRDHLKRLNDPVEKRNNDKKAAATAAGLPPPTDLEKMNTPCCIQVSHAFNASTHKMPPSSFWRPNVNIPGGNGHYIQAVNELDVYLSGRYGRTEDIRATQKGDLAAMKKHIGGTTGILVFGEAHTEFWNGTSILQNGGGVGGMNPTYIWSRPKIFFWEIGDEASDKHVPEWVHGWWSVSDGNQYYYYFSEEGIVTYTKEKPTHGATPARNPSNEGKVTMTEHGLDIVWNPADGGQTIEKYTRAGLTSETDMNGQSNRYSPLVARKIM